MIAALLGGTLIGLSVLALWIATGRVAGISGVLGELVTPGRAVEPWRLAFLAGLLGGGFVCGLVAPGAFASAAPRSVWLLGAAGLLVGFGTRLGGGCTSGHGLWGVSRLSRRSLVATGVFMVLGAIAVAVARRLGGVA